ncbi:MAG: hypothetical protein JSS12_04970 [Verrucomicrobia bacterium]|nr:hypothetical protein [Verrucomicrobiota bacterium]
MTTAKQKFLQKLDKSLPELCKPSDLAALEVFGSKSTLLVDRRSGKGIPFISVSKHRTRYPKESVLQYAAEHFNEITG